MHVHAWEWERERPKGEYLATFRAGGGGRKGEACVFSAQIGAGVVLVAQLAELPKLRHSARRTQSTSPFQWKEYERRKESKRQRCKIASKGRAPQNRATPGRSIVLYRPKDEVGEVGAEPKFESKEKGSIRGDVIVVQKSVASNASQGSVHV